MAGNGGFEDDPLEPGCYSQLLFSEDIPCLDTDACFGFTNFNPSFDDMTNKSPRMLCFGDYANNNGKIVRDKSLDPVQISGPACTGSASVSSSYSNKTSALPKSNKKRGGSGREWVQNSGVQVGASAGSQRASKKSKSDNSTVAGGHAKVATKEKLGERITALQQLVSPFGKTDTASVLHEALGYIRFLQDQVQVLCSPYLQLPPPPSSAAPHSHGNGDNKGIEERKDDLRSRGLCLVPMELTLHVADSNGADLWSSAAMANNILSP